MTPVATDERIQKFQDMVNAPVRIGVSEFARSNRWRERLPETGCIEVVDRNGTVGYMLAPSFATAVSERIAELEDELENAHVKMLFDTRAHDSRPVFCEELKRGSLAYFDEHADAIREFLDAD